MKTLDRIFASNNPLACDVVGGIPVTPALLDAGMIPGYNGITGYCWPAPEIADNVNGAELGNLGLLPTEVDQIVAFLEALTD